MMRPYFVILSKPDIDRDLRLPGAMEPFCVQNFTTWCSVKAPVVAVPGRTSVADVARLKARNIAARSRTTGVSFVWPSRTWIIRRRKPARPQTNGICERFPGTIKDEFYDTAFLKKLCHSVEQLQTDLDAWLAKASDLKLESRGIPLRHQM